MLTNERKEFVLSKQLLKSGTSIGANIRESQNAESNADFIHKLSIALKEAGELQYWLELLIESEYLNKSEFESINNDLSEIMKLLTSIIRTSKLKIKNKI